MQIRALASSSAGNAYVVSDGVTSLLLECGIRYRDLQEGLGFRVAELAGCLVSHEHGDHACAMPGVIRAGVDVYASAGTFEALGLRSHRARPVRARERFTIGTWAVAPFEAIHDAADPLGFVLASGAERLLYLTDSAYCHYRFDGLTHLMLETNYSEEILQGRVNAGELHVAHKNRILRNHLGLERVLDLLGANDLSAVREIWLIHLSDGNSDEVQFQQTVAAATGKPVFVACKRRAPNQRSVAVPR